MALNILWQKQTITLMAESVGKKWTQQNIQTSKQTEHKQNAKRRTPFWMV